MALSDIASMTNSGSLRNRILAAAARAGKDTAWTNTNLYALCATEGWDTAWAAAKSAADAINANPDTGIRTDVITDDMITAAVQELLGTID
jgi:hypothetical protein